VGMKSQLASLISCSGMLLVLLAIGPFFETIPTCVLGSIIVVSLINVMSPLKELPRIFRVSRVDFAVFVVSGLAVLVLDVTLGLVIGFAVTLFSVVLRTQLPSTAVLGRVEDTDLYEDLQVCPSAKALPGLAILRFNAPLNFANAEAFDDFVIRLGRDGQTMGQPAEGAAPPEEPVHTVVLDCSPWCYVDMVHRQLTDRGQRLLLAGCQDTVRASFAKQGLTLEVNPGPSSACFVSLHDAALYAMATASQPQGAPLFSNFVVVEDDVEGLIVNDAGVSEDS
uniref:STAS domain-containing protein n=1 Tax=Macrostomum lignano TaxID=282301 RepID=A0A1I8GQV9_9PLAT